MGKWEVIVEFGDTEGKVSLYGKDLENSRWRFLLKYQEYNLENTPDEVETDYTVSEDELTGDWSQAVNLMSRYQWKKMRPMKIHPLFKAFLWNKINYDKEYDDCSVRWYTKCFIPEEDEDLEYRKA